MYLTEIAQCVSVSFHLIWLDGERLQYVSYLISRYMEYK